MSTEAARTVRELQMLEGMVDGAYGLGMRFCEAATAEADVRRSLELLDAFHKCSFSVRMGIRLCMTLRAPPKAAPAVERAEHETAEQDRSEREPREGLEREREREYEPVSLPKFLATLGVVAREAERLGDRLPADTTAVLPRLQGLLAQATADPPDPAPSPPTAVAVLARPPQTATRHKLMGSAAPPRTGPRVQPPWSSGSG